MAFFSGISTQKRDSASEADGGELFKGAAFIAAGVLAASFMTMEIASVVKLGLLAAGVVLCAVGVKWILKYRKDNKAFEDFVPEWDKGRGMYDRFAKELNLWYEKGIVTAIRRIFLNCRRNVWTKRDSNCMRVLYRPKEPATEQARYRENLSGTQRI